MNLEIHRNVVYTLWKQDRSTCYDESASIRVVNSISRDNQLITMALKDKRTNIGEKGFDELRELYRTISTRFAPNNPRIDVQVKNDG